MTKKWDPQSAGLLPPTTVVAALARRARLDCGIDDVRVWLGDHPRVRVTAPCFSHPADLGERHHAAVLTWARRIASTFGFIDVQDVTLRASKRIFPAAAPKRAPPTPGVEEALHHYEHATVAKILRTVPPGDPAPCRVTLHIWLDRPENAGDASPPRGGPAGGGAEALPADLAGWMGDVSSIILGGETLPLTAHERARLSTCGPTPNIGNPLDWGMRCTIYLPK